MVAAPGGCTDVRSGKWSKWNKRPAPSGSGCPPGGASSAAAHGPVNGDLSSGCHADMDTGFPTSVHPSECLGESQEESPKSYNNLGCPQTSGRFTNKRWRRPGQRTLCASRTEESAAFGMGRSKPDPGGVTGRCGDLQE